MSKYSPFVSSEGIPPGGSNLFLTMPRDAVLWPLGDDRIPLLTMGE